MPLSPELLHPLTASSVEFGFCYDRPLRTFATRYVPEGHPVQDPPGKTACTLLLCAGISLQGDTWVPVIKHFYRLTSQPQSRIHIHSVWVIERPNHGDAGLMNEPLLKEHYMANFPGMHYATAIRTFLASDFLTAHERANLIGIGHSGAAGSLIQAIEPATSDLPLKRLFTIDVPYIDRRALGPINDMYKIVKASNAKRRTSWPSVDAAMAYMTARPPWKVFHPDVRQIVAETFFRPDPARPGHVTTKTLVEQETGGFYEDGSHLGAIPFLRTILHALPTHAIFGAKKDIWPPELYRQQAENLEKDRAALASISFVKGAGHYIPVQMPEEFTMEILRLLNEHAVGPTARL